MPTEYQVPDHMAVVGDDNTDGERVQALAMEIMLVLKKQLHTGPIGPARVYEALNALAVNAAVLIGSADSVPCGELFRNTLNANLELIYNANSGIKEDDQKKADQSGPAVH